MSEWTTVVSKKNNKQSKNKIKIIVQPTSYKSSSTIKPRFDFQSQNTQQIKSISNNKLPDLKKKEENEGQPKPRFVFSNTISTSLSKKQEKTWSSICKENKKSQKIECSIEIKCNKNVDENPEKEKVESENKKQANKFTIYLYEHEVNKLLHEMKWGDFDCMMEDVIIIPNDQPKPNTKK